MYGKYIGENLGKKKKAKVNIRNWAINVKGSPKEKQMQFQTWEEEPKVWDPRHITSRDLSTLRFALSW